MKKLTILATAAMLCPLGAGECLADYRDMAAQVENVADFWLGGYASDSRSSVNNSLADDYALPGASTRVGSQKATEYYATKSSVSGGFLFKSSPLPSRMHYEFDYYSDNDWFGDFRQSYKDFFQIRLLPRRFVHNLDNLTVFDFNPVISNFDAATGTYNTSGNDVKINDALIDNYGLKIDIDQYRLRLKTPNFPLHVYSEGEIVRRKGLQQMRFLGGSGTSSGVNTRGRVRTSEAREIDQESKEFAFGTNAHLGFLEVDLSHKTRKFENDVANPIYSYEVTTGGTLDSVHNVTPELKATTNSIKIHTSHTGRIVASATYTEISKTNEYSGAKAENSVGYGELVWLPAAYLSVTTKVRHQKNEATAPESVTAFDKTGTSTKYLVNPGVASTIDIGSLGLRYSLVPKTNLSFLYTKKVKKVDEESAFDWSRPVKQTHDIYEVGFTNWVVPKVRITGKLSHTRVGTALQPLVVNNVVGTNVMNNEPEQTNQGNLGLTWSVTPKLTAFFNASAAREKTQDNRTVEASKVNKAEALREQYLASFSYRISDKIAVTPTYTFMSFRQQRDLAFGSTFDSGYTDKQKAQNFAFNLMFVPISRLNINAVVDYTITKGDYDPALPFAEQLAMFSETHSEEVNVRLDSEYDLGRGWGLGLDLRYEDWKDTSIDNPSDGTFWAGLFKISKKLYY